MYAWSVFVYSPASLALFFLVCPVFVGTLGVLLLPNDMSCPCLAPVTTIDLSAPSDRGVWVKVVPPPTKRLPRGFTIEFSRRLNGRISRPRKRCPRDLRDLNHMTSHGISLL